MTEQEIVVETLQHGKLIHDGRAGWFRRTQPIYEDEWKRLVARVKAHPKRAEFAGFGSKCCSNLWRVGIAIFEPPFNEGFTWRHVDTRFVCRTCGNTYYSGHSREPYAYR
jgi:hypothetical protein